MCPLVSAANRDRYLEDRREQILEAAITVFGKEGYSKANVADIAREAEIGKGTVYLYFKSKDEIFTSIMLERSPVLHLADCLSDLDAPIESVFRELAGTILDSLQGVLPWFQLAISDFQRFPEEAEHAYTQLYMLGITTWFIRQVHDMLEAFPKGGVSWQAGYCWYENSAVKKRPSCSA